MDSGQPGEGARTRFRPRLSFLAVVLCAAGCDGGSGGDVKPASADSQLSVLVDSLRVIPGEFTNAAPGRWDFSGDRSLLIAFEQFGDSAVAALVDCLDRLDTTQAVVSGRPVSLGYMCYAALERVAYYEWHQYQDVVENPTWPGMLDATATAEELRAAKAAWTQVVERKQYFLN